MKEIKTNTYKEAQASKEFIIMRGLPGSGKSTLAEQLKGETGQQFAADDFFMDEDGNYNWNRHQIGEAHQWNYERIKRAIEQGVSPVIVDNTKYGPPPQEVVKALNRFVQEPVQNPAGQAWMENELTKKRR